MGFKPTIHLNLAGCDGNAFVIMGKTIRLLKERNRFDDVAEYQRRATESDYEHLLAVTREYVEIVDTSKKES